MWLFFEMRPTLLETETSGSPSPPPTPPGSGPRLRKQSHRGLQPTENSPVGRLWHRGKNTDLGWFGPCSAHPETSSWGQGWGGAVTVATVIQGPVTQVQDGTFPRRPSDCCPVGTKAT